MIEWMVFGASVCPSCYLGFILLLIKNLICLFSPKWVSGCILFCIALQEKRLLKLILTVWMTDPQHWGELQAMLEASAVHLPHRSTESGDVGQCEDGASRQALSSGNGGDLAGCQCTVPHSKACQVPHKCFRGLKSTTNSVLLLTQDKGPSRWDLVALLEPGAHGRQPAIHIKPVAPLDGRPDDTGMVPPVIQETSHGQLPESRVANDKVDGVPGNGVPAVQHQLVIILLGRIG